ncbi:MAG: hypothetical protein COV72_03240 [Candidatus Omnitrophica bacterium CG11_big_fil_rev_8_21_14_0_20_42_13]|uniref:HTH luxR-type domain-containing protein n=1 Tax=Candidatus Ghiorseimicrobium undicola TaxID=1974746 RepID=A0A2H0LY58_9BACT|nr:MAG: hypothetical protein COV72_03240 [Candidatus Omnitrophica bacterium CG11_big_fil_rev_8_21_14_0_20_42_13]
MSFEEFAKQLSPKIKALARKHAPSCGFVDQDDLFQEALIYLWIKWRSGELNDKTKSYIIKGCYFDIKNFLRKAMDSTTHISLSMPIDEDGTALGETVTDKNAVDERGRDAALLIDTIRNDGLTKREKEVFEHFLKGLNTRQIGERLGISHVRVVKLEKNIWEKTRHKINH